MGGDTSIARKPGHGATSPPRKAAAAEKVPQAIPVRPAWWKRPAVLAIAGGITAALVVAAAVVVWAARRTSDNGASLAAKANPPASDLRIGQGKAAPGGPQPKGPPPPDGAPGTGGATGDQADPDSGASPTAPARPGGSAAQGPDTRNPGSGQDGSQNARPDPPAQPAGTDKADPIREKLDKARAEFDAEVKKAGELLLEALDKAKEGAQKSGKVQAVDQVNKQRAAFEKDGTVPPTKDGREFQQRKHKARLVLEYAYKAAAAEYTKAKMEARAGAVEQERKRLGQGVPLDAFQPGTVWAGKGLAEWVKLGAKPPKGTFEFEVTLTVLGRDDMHFKARYELRNGQAWEVSGAVTLKGEVAWLARDAKPTQPGQGELKFDFAGQLRDNTLVFKFLGMTADGKSSDGLLPLQLKPK